MPQNSGAVQPASRMVPLQSARLPGSRLPTLCEDIHVAATVRGEAAASHCSKHTDTISGCRDISPHDDTLRAADPPSTRTRWQVVLLGTEPSMNRENV